MARRADAKRRWPIGVGAACLFLMGSLVGGLASGEPGANRSLAHAAAGAPAALFADLKHIDKLLSKLTGELPNGKLDRSQVIDRIAAIEKAKREMVSSFFEQPVYGLKFSQVFFALDCVDSRLERVVGIEVAGRNNPNHEAVDDLKAAQSCKQKLETELQKASGNGGGTTFTTTVGSPTVTGGP